jgi:rubredoxin
MQVDESPEVVNCPNCKEGVPKTLYCLNCGYPLYKTEQGKEEEPVEAKAPEEVEPISEEKPVVEAATGATPTEIEAEKPAIVEETEAKEPSIDAVQPFEVSDEIEVEIEAEEEAPEAQEAPLAEELPTIEVEPVAPEYPQAQAEAPSEAKVEAEAVPEEPTPLTLSLEVVVEEPEVEPVVTEAPLVETPPAPEPVEATDEAISAEPSPDLVKEAVEVSAEAVKPVEAVTYTPDPLTKEVMMSLAKSLALEIKLVGLFRDGKMKEETFARLFEKYADEAKLWIGKREEMMGKLAAEIDGMQETYDKSAGELELLEIMKSIGDASEEEYAAKAPGYTWDVEHLDVEIAGNRNEIAYLEDIGKVMPPEELEALREMAGLQYNTLDALQAEDEELLAKIKDSLYKAINVLG